MSDNLEKIMSSETADNLRGVFNTMMGGLRKLTDDSIEIAALAYLMWHHGHNEPEFLKQYTHGEHDPVRNLIDDVYFYHFPKDQQWVVRDLRDVMVSTVYLLLETEWPPLLELNPDLVKSEIARRGGMKALHQERVQRTRIKSQIGSKKS